MNQAFSRVSGRKARYLGLGPMFQLELGTFSLETRDQRRCRWNLMSFDAVAGGDLRRPRPSGPAVSGAGAVRGRGPAGHVAAESDACARGPSRFLRRRIIRDRNI